MWTQISSFLINLIDLIIDFIMIRNLSTLVN